MENNRTPYRFKAIEIASKTMYAIPQQGIQPNFDFNINVEIRVQAETNLVIPFVYIDIKNGKAPAASITIACAFEIDDFANHIRVNDQGIYMIPPPLQHIIVPMSISTSRGIIFSEFRGTWLHNAIMPAVPVNELLSPASTKNVPE
jgi:hypothetical protein